MLARQIGGRRLSEQNFFTAFSRCSFFLLYILAVDISQKSFFALVIDMKATTTFSRQVASMSSQFKCNSCSRLNSSLQTACGTRTRSCSDSLSSDAACDWMKPSRLGRKWNLYSEASVRAVKPRSDLLAMNFQSVSMRLRY